MKKLDPQSPLAYQADAQPVVSTFPPISIDTTARTNSRLIVLVPADVDASAATRQIWKLADATGRCVQLLSLYKEIEEEPALRRRLITIASLLQDGGTSAQTSVEHGTDWVEAVEAHYHTGDVIVCFEEQHTGLLHRPLGQVLESSFKATVYILSTFTPQRPPSSTLSQVGTLLGFVAIMISFTLLQVNIVQYPEGWLQNILLIFSIIAEFWMIWVWHSHFG